MRPVSSERPRGEMNDGQQCEKVAPAKCPSGGSCGTLDKSHSPLPEGHFPVKHAATGPVDSGLTGSSYLSVGSQS